MASYVLTLIGNLDTELVNRACQGLNLIAELDWLAEGEACDIHIYSDDTPEKITDQIRNALDGEKIDVACSRLAGRRKKILISDMDSTVIDQECINEMGNRFGVGEQISAVTASVINGDISFPDALKKRLSFLAGMERAEIERIYDDTITIKAGAKALVQTMRHHGAYCVLVSGGFTFFTSRIADRLGFHDHEGNELDFDGDSLTGNAIEPILGRSAKLKTLTLLCAEKGIDPSDVLAVGDGANDIKMIEAAGLGVAIHASDRLKEAADVCIEHNDLTALLYVQGFRKSEFIVS